MTLSNDQLTEAKNIYHLYWNSYMKGELETFVSTLDEDFEMIGTSESEVAHNKAEGIAFFKAQLQEVVGKADMRNRQITAKPLGDMVLVNETCDIYVLGEPDLSAGSQDWTFYSRIRISTLLHETNTGWKVIQQHGSLPDMRVQEGETIAFEKITKENLELRDAIKRRTIELENKTKELEIEAALERVRTVAMGMKKPEDMLDICRIISEQLQQFRVEKIRNIQTAIIDEEKGIYLCYQYFTPYDKKAVERTAYLKSPVEHGMVRQMLASKDGHFTGTLAGKELEEFREHRKAENHFPDPLLDKAKELDYCFLSIGQGGLGLTLYQPLDALTLSLFQRFHQVFSLAFQRFRDIELAQAQAREAQIEAGLERVRARSMAMHRTEELQEAAEVLNNELIRLGLRSINQCGYAIYNEEKNNQVLWLTKPDGTAREEFTLPINGETILDERYKSWKRQDPLFYQKVTHDQFQYHLNLVFDQIGSKVAQEIARKEMPENPHFYCANFHEGYLHIVADEALDLEEEQIMIRFTRVFSQTYTRFLDLQKAEAQAREAQIEAALERVRAQTMAMHSSEDVGKCVVKMFAELTALGVDEGTRFGIGILNHENENNQLWTARKDGEEVNMHIGHLDMSWHPLLKSAREAWKAQVPIHKYVLEGEDLLDYYRMLNTAPDYKIQIPLEKLPKKEIQHCFIFEHGFFYAFTPFEFQPELIQITKRFSSQFGQTYRRYLDLVRAEAQAREAQIEAALERVRARSMAMQKSDELHDVLSVLFEQFDVLGIHPVNVFLSLFSREDKTLTYRATGTGGSRTQGQQVVSLDSLDVWQELFEKWKNDNSESVEVIYYDKEILPTLFGLLKETFSSMPENERLIIDDFPEGGYTAHGYTPFGYIGFNHNRMPTDEEKDILTKFASEFGRIYQRFLDIERAEAQSRESEIQLALERVRARTMGMQTSEELADVAFVLFQQLRSLGGNLWGTGFGLCNLDSDLDSFWFANENGVFPPVSIPNTTDSAHKQMFEGWKSGKDFLAIDDSGDDLKSHYEYLLSLPEVKPFFQKILDEGLSFPNWQQWNAAYFKQGYLLIITLEPYPDSEILKRFAKVFEQTYTRFLDLQKAEAQAREAQIEAALERVRSRSMSMHKSDEFPEVIQVVFEQFRQLNFNIDSAQFDVSFRDTDDFNLWTAVPGRPYPELQHIPYRNNAVFNSIKNAKEAGLDFISDQFSKEEKDEFFEFFFQHYPDVPEERKQFIFSGPGISRSAVLLSNVVLGIQNYSGIPFTDSENEILKRFAKAFEQAYTRFLDLQKAEAQVRESQIEAALERVRSRSLAMHKSAELTEVVAVLFEKLKDLQIPFTAVGIATGIEGSKDLNAFVCGQNDAGLVITNYRLPYFNNPIPKDLYKALEKQSDFFVGNYSKEEKDTFYKYVIEHTAEFRHLPEDIKRMIFDSPTYSISMVAVKNAVFNVNEFEGKVLAESEIGIIKRFARVFDQAYTRFLDLQKAEAQAREAKIEAALEKIRSRTMGMQSSEELQEVANLLFLEVQSLGIPSWSCGYNILSPDKKVATNFMSNEGTIQKPFDLPLTLEPSLLEFYRFLQSEESFFTQELGGKDLESHYNFMKSLPELTPVFEGIEKAGIALPSYQINHLCKFTHGYLLFITYEPVPDAHDIFQRFTKVFDQTYTRFLDIKKAEAQTREAKIEVALEKVRSRTMGMQKSDELADVANVLFEEMNELVHNLWTCGFVLCEKDRTEDEWWLSLEDGFTRGFFLPNVNDYAHAHLYEGWLKKDDFRTVQLEGDQLQAHYDWLMEIPVAKRIFDDMEAAGMQRPEWQKLHAAYFSKGYLVIITREPCPEEAIFKRFAQVFDLTCTRFLDLKKAEEQAREAQIEASLEKVRSRSLAMQNPAELIEVAQLLREEMGALGVEELETSSIYIHEENSGLTQCWFTIKNSDDPAKAVTDQMTIDLQDTWVGRQMLDFYRSPENQTSILMQGANRKAWIQYCEEKTDLFGTSNFYGDIIPERTYHLYKFSNGYIGAAAPGEISKESWDLLKRATAVFSFAYTRFQDLQKAEASAIAAMRQASLDRIRADISSMRNADDLDRITPLIFKELTVLGVPFIRCGVFIIQEKEEIVEAYLSSPDGNSLGVLKLLYQASELTFRTVEAWRKGNVYRQHWNKEDFVQWIHQLMEQDQIQDSSTYQGTAAPPESLDLHFVPFTQGMLYVGAISPLDDKELELVQALAKAFAIAFARYEDFVKLEKAKAEVESAMSELKATQSQLVQQEKLASLGQLTAGIAHEIKNPLNFVNNFSEVSIEMIEEIKEERAKSQETRDETLVDEILEDIQSNLGKIHEHGSRANGIVTSMLQHSRGGTGKKEPTDLNALIKEYSNLAFHGMRAGKNPINVVIDLQLDQQIRNVPLVSEDFSRVLLNLCNNAFDAMRTTAEIRPPKLSIRTKLQSEKILIEVEDNGPGIPDEIKDKILQPFFTTKKGTEGTGLGLSITHDIVKAHGGELRVESQEEAKTLFIVLLPTKL